MTHDRLRGIAASLTILLVVAGVPALLLGIGAAPWNLDVASWPNLSTRRDDGTLALELISLVAWTAWLVLATIVVAEITAALNGTRLPAIRGLALPQHAASQLVAVAAMAFVAAPTLATLLAPTAHASTTTTPSPAEVSPPPAVNAEPAPRPDEAEPREEPITTTTYTTKRGDSLWKIANRLLGDGTYYTELVDLNRDVLGDRPDFIPVGLALRVPTVKASPHVQDTRDYIVQEGDTLWDIAARELGDPERYPEIFEASRHLAQPDDMRLTDPDLIFPGWTLAIPAAAPRATAGVKDPPRAPREHQISATPPLAPRSIEHTTEQSLVPETEVNETSTESADTAAPGWLVPGLTVGGAVLAGSLLLALRAYRRMQLRYRRPGQVVEPTPETLRPTEQTAVVTGTAVAENLEFLDRALRHLAAGSNAHGESHPSIERVTLGASSVTVHLAHPAVPPAPWSGAGTRWSLATDTDIPDDDIIPPYPLLVSFGQTEGRSLELINLEHFTTISLSGDPVHAEALARHVAAELALSPWSVLVEVHTIGIGSELEGLDQRRLRHHPNTSQLPQLLRELTASRDSGAGDPDPYRAVIAANGVDLAELRALLEDSSTRLGVALVTRVGEAGTAELTLHIDSAGRLSDDGGQLALRAAGLTSSEAATCAAIVEATQEATTVPIPVFEAETDDLHALIDQAGALRSDLTEARPSGPAGENSILPGSTEDYVQAAATTAKDVEALAPMVSRSVTQEIEDADPALDADLADWHDPESALPELTVLGPVGLSAHGELPPERRQSVLLDVLAYIAFHPEGVVSRELAEVYSRSESRMRNDVRDIRAWLGTNPNTGLPHLPAGDASRLYRETGTPGYQVDHLLIDLDLFRRLRARGQARGANGLPDLLSALRLVAGTPFTLPRGRGWSWLYDDRRLHETTGAAIVDVAHLLVTRSLAEGDVETARTAAQLACSAVPFDEVCRLDLVKIALAEGHTVAAAEMLARDVPDRTDDYVGTVEQPDRTKTITNRSDWETRRSS